MTISRLPRTRGDRPVGAAGRLVLLPEILKYPRYPVEPLDNVDGRRKQVKARKKAMVGAATAATETDRTSG